MIRPSVKAVSAGTQLYGKSVDLLQSDIVIGETEITGTLNHVTDYTDFNPSAPDEQSGNYLALSLTAAEGVTITTELVNGTKGPVTVNDGYCVYRITNKDDQSIKVTFAKGEETQTKTYGLSGLDCKQQ